MNLQSKGIGVSHTSQTIHPEPGSIVCDVFNKTADCVNQL